MRAPANLAHAGRVRTLPGMLFHHSALSWSAALAVTVPLALLLLLALPTGAPLQIAMHAILLVVGAGAVLALRPSDAE